MKRSLKIVLAIMLVVSLFTTLQVFALTQVTNTQLLDMASRTCDYITAHSGKVPSIIYTDIAQTDSVTAAEFHYMLSRWLRFYKNNSNTPPATVSIVRGTLGPSSPSGTESGTIQLADVLAKGESNANYIDANSQLPNFSTVGTTQYTTKAMFSVFARTINWYQDNGSMPTYASVQATTAPSSWTGLAQLRVAVFNGAGTSTNCVNSTISILNANGIYAATISASSIRAGGLSSYDVIAIPGGSASDIATDLQQSGCAAIAQFVAGGKGYMGTCAGAYLAPLGYTLGGVSSTTWLNIVDAQIIDLSHWNRGTGSAQIRVTDRSHPIWAGFAEYIWGEYFNGPLLGVGNDPSLPNYVQGAVYVSDIHTNAPAGIMPGTVAMTTSTYQSGKCVLYSFHPELTSGLEQLVVRAAEWVVNRL